MRGTGMAARLGLLAGLLLAGLVGAQVVQESASGAVDWQQRVVRATGIGMPSAVGGRAGQIRAARADALRKILESVEGMVLTSETTVQDFMLENDRIQTEIRGVCRNFRELDEEYMSDGTIEMTVEMVLGPEFNDVLIGELAWQSGEPVPVQYSDLEPGNSIYTGLIVDCSGIDIRPALAPRILTEAGEEVYGNGWADRDWALQHGLVSYVRTVEQAKALSERVGEKPLLVKAVGSSGTRSADVLVPDKDGKILHSLSENLKFLSECRVVFVLD